MGDYKGSKKQDKSKYIVLIGKTLKGLYFHIQSVHAIVELCFKRRVMFLRHELCSKKTDYVQATWLMLRFGRRKSITQSFGA